MSASDSCRVVCVDPARVRDFWPHVSRLIRAAVWRGGTGRFELIERRVIDGDALLWLIWDGAAILSATVTELQRSDRDLACMILACGGREMARWLHLISAIEDYARAEGCDVVRLFGRKGWARALTHYRSDMVLLERKL